MNIETANAIGLPAILNKIGFQPAKKRGHDEWFYSPFRTEKTPSFHVNTAKNIWYDFGEGKGGKVIDFIKTYLQSQNEDHTVIDVLRWLNNMQEAIPPEIFIQESDEQSEATLNIRKVTFVQHRTLVNYLNTRCIPLISAKKYLKEAHVYNKKSGKNFFALALSNENGGYELRNKFFKGCVASKAISFIRGSKLFSEDIHVFEGIMDFLSALTLQKGNAFDGDVIILNSLACLPQILPYIKNYSYKTLNSWLDNDEAGYKAAQYLKDLAKVQANMGFKSMQELYAPHKDVNEWHKQRLK